MSENLTNLFNENTAAEGGTNARSLAGTAQLTSVATSLTNDVLKAVESDFECYKDKVAASKADHGAMDTLIASVINLNETDVEFLKELDESVLESMLKSQQSKRSRSKSKAMTMDNYRNMMTAAIAENLIRLVTGHTKTVGSSRRFSGSVEYTAEQLEELAIDQEKLRKEIRNVQSKKSIMKSKEGFNEDDERWQQLLVAESQLKGLRTETTKIVQVDETKNKLTELLGGKDIHSMKPAEAKKLLEQITGLAASEETDEEPEAAE